MPPDTLGPPDTTDVTRVRCPTCRGEGLLTIPGCRPSMQAPCPTCQRSGTAYVYWATIRTEPRHTHLMLVDSSPADSLCEHAPVPLDELTEPTGTPCVDCMTLLSHWNSH